MTELLILVTTLFKIMLVLIPVMGLVAYLTYFERKIIGAMQLRNGPNRVGWYGLLQPLADAIKLLFKEIVIPRSSNKFLFFLAPVLSIAPALAAWAVIPFSQGLVLSDINVGLLYLLAMTSLGVYGIILAGWSSNSKYAFLGAVRSAAQIISYEIGMGFVIVIVIMAAGSMNLSEIVMKQSGGILSWFALPLFPMLVVYWICAVAETNRAPFDIAEGESEIVAGFHVEYSAMLFSVFFMAEYANMILVSVLAVIMFLGGWLSPFQGIPFLEPTFAFVPGVFWLMAKTSIFLFLFIWFRATFPRYRYDQIMSLGWKVFIPLTLLWLIVVLVLIRTGLWF